MVFAWIVLAVLTIVFGVRAVSAISIGARVRGRAVLAIVALAGLFAVAITEGSEWMITLASIIAGLLLLMVLVARLVFPPVESVEPRELSARILRHVNGAGHTMSMVVHASRIKLMLGGTDRKPRFKVTHHQLSDFGCSYCFVEHALRSLFPTEEAGNATVREYRYRLQAGPHAEIHVRRAHAVESWHIEFVVPRYQPGWGPEYTRSNCQEHLPPIRWSGADQGL